MWRHELAVLLRIAWPMMLAQGGLVAMGLVDTVYAGRVSPADMAAVALGNNVVSVVMAAGLGLVMGLEPFVAQAVGRARPDRAVQWRQQATWMAWGISLPLTLISLGFPTLFSFWDIDPTLRDKASDYIWARALGHGFCFAFTAHRAYLSSTGETRPILWTVLAANGANVALDHGLVLGLGLGAAGVGLATSGCWAVMWALMRFFSSTPHLRAEPPHGASIRSLARVGTPIGLQMALEVAIFGAVSVAVATEGAVALAGHQIALSMAALVFMTVTGLAIAATARVGYWVGAQQTRRGERVGYLSMAVAAAIMVGAGAVFWTLGQPIAAFFAPESEEVTAAGAALLKMAALFAVFDGLQAVAGGALRGLGDTAFTFWANMVGHWAIGFPVALWAGQRWGAVGYWWGLVAGLAVVAAVLTVRFSLQVRRPVAALDVG